MRASDILSSAWRIIELDGLFYVVRVSQEGQFEVRHHWSGPQDGHDPVAETYHPFV